MRGFNSSRICWLTLLLSRTCAILTLCYQRSYSSCAPSLPTPASRHSRWYCLKSALMLFLLWASCAWEVGQENSVHGVARQAGHKLHAKFPHQAEFSGVFRGTVENIVVGYFTEYINGKSYYVGNAPSLIFGPADSVGNCHPGSEHLSRREKIISALCFCSFHLFIPCPDRFGRLRIMLDHLTDRSFTKFLPSASVFCSKGIIVANLFPGISRRQQNNRAQVDLWGFAY